MPAVTSQRAEFIRRLVQWIQLFQCTFQKARWFFLSMVSFYLNIDSSRRGSSLTAVHHNDVLKLIKWRMWNPIFTKHIHIRTFGTADWERSVKFAVMFALCESYAFCQFCLMPRTQPVSLIFHFIYSILVSPCLYFVTCVKNSYSVDWSHVLNRISFGMNEVFF